MSLHNGTAAETERKKALENEGHIILKAHSSSSPNMESSSPIQGK